MDYFLNSSFKQQLSKEKTMKAFRIAGMMMLAVISCLSFTACSDDEDGSNASSPYATEILGMWECIEGGYRMDLKDRVKFFSGEFDEAQWNKGGTLKGKKCIHMSYGHNSYEENYGVDPNPTESDWDSHIIKVQGSYNFDDLYILSGNKLSIFECDYDRYLGTISIEGNIMTFTYMYQNWRCIDNTHQVLEEESGPYTVKFKKI